MCKCSLPARIRSSPTFIACGGFVLQPPPERRGLVRLQWPYFVSETLLHCCSTQLKGLTNGFCLKYCTEVILYMCICIVL